MIGKISEVPWRTSGRSEVQSYTEVHSNRGIRILEARFWGTGYAEDDQNVALAAAAPDLLSVLELLTEMVRTDSARGRLAKKIFDQTMDTLSQESQDMIRKRARILLNDEFDLTKDRDFQKVSLREEGEEEESPGDSCTRWEDVRPIRARVKLASVPKKHAP